MSDRRAQVIISLLVTTCFAIFCGLRWYAGQDYGAYIDIFTMVPTLGDFTLEKVAHIHGEIGYKFINSVLKTMSLESYMAVFLIALLSLYLKFYFYAKFASNVFFCVCFYLALHFYRAEFIQVRMALGLAILCLSLVYYLKNENFKFVLAVIAATSIHSICVLFLVLPAVRNFKLKYMLFLAFVLPITFSFIPLLKPVLEILAQLLNAPLLTILYNYAFNGPHGDNVLIYNLVPARHLIVVLLLILVYPRLSRLDYTNILIIKIYLTGIILSSFFMDLELLYARAIYLFDIVEPVVLCMMIYMIRNVYIRAGAFFVTSAFALILMSRNAFINSSLFEYATWLPLIV